MFFLLLLLHVYAADEACLGGMPPLVSDEFTSIPTVIFPKVMKRNMHFVFRNYKYAHPDCKMDEVWVQGPKYTEDGYNSVGKYVKEGDSHQMLGISFCMPKSEFDRERRLAKSIFETPVASGANAAGTSFYIGGNIVLTNNHVAGGGKNPEDCRKTRIFVNDQKSEEIKCKKILYCEPGNDFCFVEMNPPAGKKSLSEIAAPLNLNCAPITAQNAKLIGNASMEGMQASDGPVDAQRKDGRFRHRVPMVPGSSGSPIFSDNGQVIGLNSSHDVGKDYVSDLTDKTNYGTSMNYIFNKLKLELMFDHSPMLWSSQKAKNILKIYQTLPPSSNCRY